GVKFGLALIGLVLLTVASVRAQESPQPTTSLIEKQRNVEDPYAGKIEARIGGSREFPGDKLRLDIGASFDMLTLYEPVEQAHHYYYHTQLTLGADFFTWTRLRSTGNFKFPVEAVDYYFGVNA